MTKQTIALLLSSTIAFAGCKGETVVKIDPNTQAQLDDCVKKRDQLSELNRTLTDQNAQLLREKGTGEIVIALEGNALVVKPAKPGANPPIDDKAAREASTQFLDVVAKSRGAIQKCYEQALKKNTGLQAKTVTLSVSASFSKAGAFQNASFAPSLGDTFDQCIRTVASKWALPQDSPAMTFKAQVSLTPS